MPCKPLRPCSVVGCPRPATVGGKCAGHAAQQERQRGSAAARGYGQRWRRIRDKYLAAHPWCVRCGARATDVDHIRPRRQGGSDDDSNLQALCHACHSAKTMRQSVG